MSGGGGGIERLPQISGSTSLFQKSVLFSEGTNIEISINFFRERVNQIYQYQMLGLNNKGEGKCLTLGVFKEFGR